MKNPICAILWLDAAYTFESQTPKELPQPRLTTGFIIEANDQFIFIATNVSYNEKEKTLCPVDGFVIPKKTIINFKAIGNYDSKN